MSEKTYTDEEAAYIAARRGLPRFVKLALRQEGLSRKAKEEPKFKFYNLYSQVLLADTLRCAWEQARANKGAAGVDHVTFEDIERSKGGVDGFLTSIQQELKAKTYRASPVKRVYIEKANGKLRPLGIPTIRDRVVQTAVKLVIEPIFEADFHDCSYGFRPGRNAQMAVEKIAAEIKGGKTKVYDADLSSYFDTIPHDKLFLALRKRIVDGSVLALIRQWLKATIVEPNGTRKNPHGKGTPQGGVISPLLSNVFLHWFETCANIIAKGMGQAMTIVRYADDFVMLAREWKDGFRQKVEESIEGRFGLVVNREKTRCVDMKTPHESLSFLGYEFRYVNSRRKVGPEYLEYGPSRKSVMKVCKKVKELTISSRGLIPVEKMISDVNRVVDGWGRYFRCGYPSRMFEKVNWYASQRMYIWLNGRGQRGYKLKYANSYCAEFARMGLLTLSRKRYRQ